MGIETAILATAAVVSAGATIAATSQQRKARKTQEEAQRVQTASERTQQIRAERQRVREERIRRARILQSAESSGVTGSSSQIGGVSSLQGQLQSAQAFTAGQTSAVEGINRLNQSASRNLSNADTFTAISNISQQLGNSAQTLFK